MYPKNLFIGAVSSVITVVIMVYLFGLAKQIYVHASELNEQYIELSFASPEQLPKHVEVDRVYSIHVLIVSHKNENVTVRYQTLIDSVEKSDTTTISAEILTLQTQLQASYQTTSILSKLNLTSYLR